MSRRRLLPGDANRPAGALALIAAAALAVTSCASGSTSIPNPGPTSPVSTTTGTTGTTGGPNPNATETPPPGDIPDTQTFVAFTPPAGGYRITVPEGWAMTGSGASVTFADKYTSVQVTTGSATQPTVASVTATALRSVRSASTGFVAGTVTLVQRTAGPVVLATYRADSAPNPVTGKVVSEAVERYAFWRAGRQVVVTVSAPVGADNVDAWRTVTNSLRWTR